jgi:hypothetical protein
MKEVLFTCLLSFCAFIAQGQVSTNNDTTAVVQHVIIKNDGTEYIGVIISDDGREVLIETRTIGKVYISKSDIKSITLISENIQLNNGEYSPSGPFTTRYSFTTNALPIKKGENYAMISLYGPEVHFALSNKLSLGILTTWIGSPFVLAGKYSIPTRNEKMNFSVGTLMGTSGYLQNGKAWGGLHFVNFTYGSRNSNFTVGAGYGYYKGIRNVAVLKPEYANFSDTIVTTDRYFAWSGLYDYQPSKLMHGPVFSLAGITKVGARSSLFIDVMLSFYYRETITKFQVDEIQYGTSTTPFIYYVETTTKKTWAHFLVFMPGMRFQKTEKMAFQVSLTGLNFTQTNFGNTSSSTIPFPMLTWFFKL